MHLDEFLNQVSGKKTKVGDGWQVICPAHDDSTPSLTVHEREDKLLLHCKAGCETRSILESLSLEFSDLSANGDEREATLSDFANYVNLPESWLEERGVRDAALHTTTQLELGRGVEIPHFHREGEDPVALSLRKKIYGSPKYLADTRHFDKPPYIYMQDWASLCANDQEKKRSIILCEGQTDALVLRYNDIPVLGICGAGNYHRINVNFLNSFGSIFIVEESDSAGQKFSYDLSAHLRNFGFCGKIRIIKLDPYKDVLEVWKGSGGAKEFREVMTEFCKKARVPKTEEDLISWEEEEEEEIKFIWPHYIPKGFVTLMAGEGGQGKSFLAARIASSVSSGGTLPGLDGKSDGFEVQDGKVLFLTPEDSPRLYGGIKTRLRLHGANMANIRCLNSERFTQKTGSEFSFSNDGLNYLISVINSYEPTLVIIDPIIRFMSTHEASVNSNNIVRRMMDKLSIIAQQKNCAILCMAHFKKGSGDGVNQILGAVDFVNSARSVLMVYENLMIPASKTEEGEPVFHGVMFQQKTNVFVKSPGMCYRIHSVEDEKYPDRRPRPGMIQFDGLANFTIYDIQKAISSGGKDREKFQRVRNRIIQTLMESDGFIPVKKMREICVEMEGGSWDLFQSVMDNLEEVGHVVRKVKGKGVNQYVAVRHVLRKE